jgi:hypothetical protein
VFVFKQLLNRIPLQTDVKTARRRWVLLQSLSGRYGLGNDIFVEVLMSLRRANTDIMQSTPIAERQDLSLAAEARLDKPLFLVIDKAQAAADSFKKSFRPHITETDVRSILHAMYGFLQYTAELSFQGLGCQQMW